MSKVEELPEGWTWYLDDDGWTAETDELAVFVQDDQLVVHGCGEILWVPSVVVRLVFERSGVDWEESE